MVNIRPRRYIEKEEEAISNGTVLYGRTTDDSMQHLLLEVLLDIRNIMNRIYEKGFTLEGRRLIKKIDKEAEGK